MTTADHYLPKPIYDELVERLGAIQPDRFTGKIEHHQIVEALGEIGGIWPATVLADAERLSTGSNCVYDN